ncbi:hypothetical protein C0993_000929, partial [Termitomyces sp. T159_Od127]
HQRPTVLPVPSTTPVIPNIVPLSCPPSVFLIPGLPPGPVHVTPPHDGLMGGHPPQGRAPSVVAPLPRVNQDRIHHAQSPPLQHRFTPIPVQRLRQAPLHDIPHPVFSPQIVHPPGYVAEGFPLPPYNQAVEHDVLGFQGPQFIWPLNIPPAPFENPPQIHLAKNHYAPPIPAAVSMDVKLPPLSTIPRFASAADWGTWINPVMALIDHMGLNGHVGSIPGPDAPFDPTCRVVFPPTYPPHHTIAVRFR